jgi:predicted GTPase
MYSGRLRGGSETYRVKFGPLAAAAHRAEGDLSVLDRLDDVTTTIAVIGQVKAGKSSLINALMQGQVTSTSVLPETRQVTRHQYDLPDSSSSVTLLDSPGYSEANVSRQQSNEIQAAVEAADIVLLVMAANMPARQPDVQMIGELLRYYQSQPQLRPPTIIGVITHIDQLRPVREWSPPYDWRHPRGEKERAMAATVDYLQELFGDSVTEFVCVYTGDLHPSDSSVAEKVVPLLVDNLDAGHSAAVLKAFYKQITRDRFQRLVSQLIGLGKTLR